MQLIGDKVAILKQQNNYQYVSKNYSHGIILVSGIRLNAQYIPDIYNIV